MLIFGVARHKKRRAGLLDREEGHHGLEFRDIRKKKKEPCRSTFLKGGNAKKKIIRIVLPSRKVVRKTGRRSGIGSRRWKNPRLEIGRKVIPTFRGKRKVWPGLLQSQRREGEAGKERGLDFAAISLNVEGGGKRPTSIRTSYGGGTFREDSKEKT